MKHPKTVVLVSGPPGAGKSTFSEELVKKFGYAWLEIDCIGDPFTLSRGAAYKTNIEPKAIQGILNTAKLNLSAGNSVLLDLPWTLLTIEDPTWITKLQDLATQAGATLIVFECYLSEQELYNRIAARDAERDSSKIQDGYQGENWNQFVEDIGFAERIGLPHLAINTEESVAENFSEALNYVADNTASNKLERSFTYE